MTGRRVAAILVLLAGAAVGYFVYWSQGHSFRPFKLGLDLSGGTQLVYKADLSKLPAGDAADSLAALRDTIEKRVNLFGVSEPLVQTEHVSAAISGQAEDRLIVELPGVTDTQK